MIQKKTIHLELIKLLKEKKYDRYISIEMKNLNDIEKIKKVANYVKNIIKEET